MTYQQAVAFIHSLLPFGIKPGLERMKALLDQMGHPERQLQFVHVAGTNGKGSTCNMLSRILMQAGYKTGLFTSPYVVDFRERMQVNGVMIAQDALATEVERIQPLLERLKQQQIQPTEFEVITAVAFSYFAKEKCDIVVLEVGLGGRLDSTNVIPPPLVSVLTSISFDHMAVLGNTLEAITAEKCGIIKSGTPVVSYPLQCAAAAGVIADTCRQTGSALVIPQAASLQITAQSLAGTAFQYRGSGYQLALIGAHQVYNALVVIECAGILRQSGFCIPDQAIAQGIAQTVVPARMELVCRQPCVLMDGGHNTDCAQALHALLSEHLCGKRIIACVGMMADKEYDKYLALVAPHFAEIYCTAAEHPRSLPAEALSAAASAYCEHVAACADVPQAVAASLAALQAADALVICGSFYLAAEVRPYLQKKFK